MIALVTRHRVRMRMLFLAIVILIPRVDSVPLLTVMTPLVPVLLSDAEADLTVGQDTAESVSESLLSHWSSPNLQTRSNVETTTEVAPPVKALTVNREDWMREAMSDKHRKEGQLFEISLTSKTQICYSRNGPKNPDFTKVQIRSNWSSSRRFWLTSHYRTVPSSWVSCEDERGSKSEGCGTRFIILLVNH